MRTYKGDGYLFVCKCAFLCFKGSYKKFIVYDDILLLVKKKNKKKGNNIATRAKFVKPDLYDANPRSN